MGFRTIQISADSRTSINVLKGVLHGSYWIRSRQHA